MHTHTHTHTHIQATGLALDKPFGSCECVAHLGWCSHQVALAFLFVNFLKLFDSTATCDDFRKVYPRSVFIVQREGCPWTHAVSKETAEQISCFNKERWGGKKSPESMRDTEEKLVPRVKLWYERWLKEARDPEKQHVFAVQKVITIYVMFVVSVSLILSSSPPLVCPSPVLVKGSSGKGARNFPEKTGSPGGGRPGAREILQEHQGYRPGVNEQHHSLYHPRYQTVCHGSHQHV